MRAYQIISDGKNADRIKHSYLIGRLKLMDKTGFNFENTLENDISTAENNVTNRGRIAGKVVMWLINTKSQKNKLSVNMHSDLKIYKCLHN